MLHVIPPENFALLRCADLNLLSHKESKRFLNEITELRPGKNETLGHQVSKNRKNGKEGFLQGSDVTLNFVYRNGV